MSGFGGSSFGIFAPILCAFLGGMLLLCVELFCKFSKNLYAFLAVLILLIDALFLYLVSSGVIVNGDINAGIYTLFGLIFVDKISLFAQWIIIIASAVVVLMGIEIGRDSNALESNGVCAKNCILISQNRPEFYSLLLFSVGGFQLMSASTNLAVLLLGIEVGALALYAIIAFEESKKGFEAALKYFIMGAVAAAFFALGVALLYASLGTADIAQIAHLLNANSMLSIEGSGVVLGKESSVFLSMDSASSVFGSKLGAVILLGAVLILGAVAFKCSAVPFHAWTPDVYEGANPLFAVFVSIVPKIAAFVVLLRFVGAFLDAEIFWWLLCALAVLTMSVANLVALTQSDVKRMLAFSSISHAGFIMVAILVDSALGLNAIFIYWTLFAIANLGAFGMLAVIANARHCETPRSGVVAINNAEQPTSRHCETSRSEVVAINSTEQRRRVKDSDGIHLPNPSNANATPSSLRASGKAASVAINNAELRRHAESAFPYERFLGMVKTAPACAIALGIFMLALIGIPPLGVFFGKAYIFTAALERSHFVLAAIMALNSAIACYYYLKLIVFMFLKPQNTESKTPHIKIPLTITTCALATIFSYFLLEFLVL